MTYLSANGVFSNAVCAAVKKEAKKYPTADEDKERRKTRLYQWQKKKKNINTLMYSKTHHNQCLLLLA